jgi:hypothetical protein
MQVFFVNNDGGGFANNVEVPEGMTYERFFNIQMPSRSASNYKIRVTRNGERFTPQSGTALQEGDRVSITPNKITGYKVAGYRVASFRFADYKIAA